MNSQILFVKMPDTEEKTKRYHDRPKNADMRLNSTPESQIHNPKHHDKSSEIY